MKKDFILLNVPASLKPPHHFSLTNQADILTLNNNRPCSNVIVDKLDFSCSQTTCSETNNGTETLRARDACHLALSILRHSYDFQTWYVLRWTVEQYQDSGSCWLQFDSIMRSDVIHKYLICFNPSNAKATLIQSKKEAKISFMLALIG